MLNALHNRVAIISLLVAACGQSFAQTEQAGQPAVDLAELSKNDDGFTAISVEQLAQTLAGLGYTTILEVDGGIAACNRPVINW